MKYSTKEIHRLVTDITGVSLEQMRSSSRQAEIVAARKLYLNLAEKYCDYKKQFEITGVINKKEPALDYARKCAYDHDIRNLMVLAEFSLQERSEKDMYHLSLNICRLNADEKIQLINSAVSSLPAHMRAKISIH